MSSTTTTPIYTIEVGSPGSFTNDANVDVSATVNTEIDAAPAGDQIDIVFNPGTYGVVTPILLPSNTSVFGNDSTLQPLTTNGWQGNTALIANKDAYSENSYDLHVNNTDGSSVVIDDGPTSTVTMGTGSSSGIIDTNISVQGMTFNDNGYWVFGTWFTNAKDIDVQNNTYIGGPDGNAFVDVVDAVVASNIAVGQVNAAYDNWCGPTNVTIQDNLSFMSGTSQSGWSVLINSCPSGNPANPGNAGNDGIVGNVFSGYWQNGSSGNADPLESYGFTTESDITDQGNVTSGLDVGGAGCFYSANVVAGDLIQDNLFSNINMTSGQTFPIISAYSSSNSLASNGTIVGNLIVGASEEVSTSPLIVNQGNDPNTSNNAIVASSQAGQGEIVTTTLNGAQQSAGNIYQSGTTFSGSGVSDEINIISPPSLSIVAGGTTSLSEISISDPLSDDDVSVTLLTTFGTLSFAAGFTGLATYGVNDGDQSVILSGNVEEVNQDLSQLTYSTSSEGWDDSIEITISDSIGSSATRYVSLLSSSTSSTPELTILPAGSMGSLPGASIDGSQGVAPFNLSGEIAIASSGSNLINMGSTISAAFLGIGNSTVLGGLADEYIASGQGNADVSLSGGGKVTVAGGSGSLEVTAATGDDLVEAGDSSATVTAGTGNVSVATGLGDATINGGSGSLFLASLPQDGGNLLVSLAGGNSTILALSGNCSITSDASSSNLMLLGLGNNFVASAGSDTIECGAGNNSVAAVGSANDLILAGSGQLVFSAAAGALSTVVAGTGSLTLLAPGELATGAINDDVDREDIMGSSGSGSVSLATGISVASETLEGGTMVLSLSDGTVLDIADPSAMPIWELNGSLALDPISIASGVIFGDGISSDTSNVTWSIAGSASGSDTINASFFKTVVSTAGANNVVQLAGNETLNAGGSNDLAVAVNGNNIIFITGSADAIITNSSDTIFAAPGGCLSDAFFVGYTGGSLDFINQSSIAATIAGGANCLSGSLTVNGGSAGGYYQGGAGGNNSLVGGTGSGGTTLVGSGNNNFLSVQGSGDNALFADPNNGAVGGGAATLAAGPQTDDNTFVAGTGTESLISFGSGVQAFFVGADGTETFTGSAAVGASNNYYFLQGPMQGGTDIITNFNLQTDQVFINPFGAGAVSVQSAENTIFAGEPGALIQLTDNTIIKLMGMTLSSADLESLPGSTSF